MNRRMLKKGKKNRRQYLIHKILDVCLEKTCAERILAMSTLKNAVVVTLIEPQKKYNIKKQWDYWYDQPPGKLEDILNELRAV